MELHLNPKIIYNIIEKIHAFYGKEDNGQEDLAMKEDEDWESFSEKYNDDITYLDAVQTINALSPHEQATLVALMYVGRGDYDVSEWHQALAEAKNYWTHKTGQYLLSRPLVADYLETALEMFGYAQSE